MSMRFKPAAALAAIVLLGAATGAAAADAKGKALSIDGAWKTTDVVITGANPLTNHNPQESLTIFYHGHYAAVSNQGTGPRTAAAPVATPGKPTDAEKLARYEEWAPVGAQAGTYTLKGSTLTRTPTAAKNVGAVTAGAFESDVKLTGDTLVLTTKSAAGQPARVQTITLTRVK